MDFTQLKYVREAVRQGYSLTLAAGKVHATQPGLSRRIRELEDELGVEIFERKGKRLLGLTPPGKQLLPLVERILQDAESLRQSADQFASADTGSLVIATTHTQARYALVAAVTAFRARFPRVHLELRQASPAEIADLVAEGEADIGFASDVLAQHAGVEAYDAYQWSHLVVVPKGHPLTQSQELSLQELSEYPLVTTEPGMAGRGGIDQAFAKAGLEMDVVLAARDADVIKTYVEAGLGVGIIPGIAYDVTRDYALVTLAAEHLFGVHSAKVGLRKGAFLRNYTAEFVRLLVPQFRQPGANAETERRRQWKEQAANYLHSA